MIGKTQDGWFIFTDYFSMEWDARGFSYLTKEQKRPRIDGLSIALYMRKLYVRLGGF